MPLAVGCPRCATPVAEATGGLWSCPEHGEVPPLWRPAEATYDAFAEHLQGADGFPTLMPWPMSPGWRVTDFAHVGPTSAPRAATMTCVSGTSALDGPVDVLVVTEEPGIGLGARVAGTGSEVDPIIGEGPPAVRVRIESSQVSLWPVSVSHVGGDWDRSVVVGESHGRWLWLVLRPASAMLLLRDDWILRDISVAGPQLVEMPFGGPGPAW